MFRSPYNRGCGAKIILSYTGITSPTFTHAGQADTFCFPLRLARTTPMSSYAANTAELLPLDQGCTDFGAFSEDETRQGSQHRQQK